MTWPGTSPIHPTPYLGGQRSPGRKGLSQSLWSVKRHFAIFMTRPRISALTLRLRPVRADFRAGRVHHLGSISALFGLTTHIIDEGQYTILLTAVIGSAVVPTLIAQTWFRPSLEPMEEDA
jgi:hypothetical protein